MRTTTRRGFLSLIGTALAGPALAGVGFFRDPFGCHWTPLRQAIINTVTRCDDPFIVPLDFMAILGVPSQIRARALAISRTDRTEGPVGGWISADGCSGSIPVGPAFVPDWAADDLAS